MASLWVAELLVSQATADKINGKHWVSVDGVRRAVECVAGLSWAWDIHATRGARAIVQVRIRQDDALVVLYDAQHPMGDVWHLGSVYEV